MHVERHRSSLRPTAARAVSEGSPGERARLAGLRRGLWPLPAAALAAGYLVRAAWPQPALRPTEVGFLFLLLAAATAAGVLRGGRSWLRYLKGARGEERAARALDALPPGYHVWHGVPLRSLTAGGRDCDHVAVGPTGVFIIETINWSGAVTLDHGRILVDGEAPDRSPLDQVKHIAAQLRADWLGAEPERGLWLRPVLCFAGAAPAALPRGAEGVELCTPETIEAVILTPHERSLERGAAAQLAVSFDQWIGRRNRAGHDRLL